MIKNFKKIFLVAFVLSFIFGLHNVKAAFVITQDNDPAGIIYGLRVDDVTYNFSTRAITIKAGLTHCAGCNWNISATNISNTTGSAYVSGGPTNSSDFQTLTGIIGNVGALNFSINIFGRTINPTPTGGEEGDMMGTLTFSVPAPTVTLTANPSSIISGQSSTLSWSSTNATSCNASNGINGWAGSKATSGTFPTGALFTSQTYSIICSGLGGNSPQANVTVIVNPPPITPLYTVSTDFCTNITSSSLTSGGNIIFNGPNELTAVPGTYTIDNVLGAPSTVPNGIWTLGNLIYSITNRGVIWSTSTIPTSGAPTLTTKTDDGSGIGAFTSNVTGLLPNKTYNFRAYATNRQYTEAGHSAFFSVLAGTTYGPNIVCTTPPASFDYLLANAGNKNVVAGNIATTSITSVLLSGTSAPVKLSVNTILDSAGQNIFNVANGISTSSNAFSVNPVNVPQSSILTLNTVSTTPVGNYTVEVKGISGGLTRFTSFVLTVSLPVTNYNLVATSARNSCVAPEGEITLSWNRISNAVSYTLYSQTGTSSEISFIIPQPASGNITTTRTGLYPGALYMYRVVANTSTGPLPSSPSAPEFASKQINSDGITPCGSGSTAPDVVLKINGADYISVVSPYTATLSWTSSNIVDNGCALSGSLVAPVVASTSVSYNTSPISATSTYTITCRNSVGATATDIVTANVVSIPPIGNTISFLIGTSLNNIATNPKTSLSVVQGARFALKWTIPALTTCTTGITPAPGPSLWTGPSSLPASVTLSGGVQNLLTANAPYGLYTFTLACPSSALATTTLRVRSSTETQF